MALGLVGTPLVRFVPRNFPALQSAILANATHRTMSQSTNSTSLDTMFAVLSSSSRRRILLGVSDHNPRDEDEFAPDAFASEKDDLERAKTQLHHIHLPKLADNRYIEWNPDTETIRRGSNFDDIAPLLRLMADHEDELPDGWP